MNKLKIYLRTAGAALLASTALASNAQTVAPTPAQTGAEAAISPDGLADIVVTAQKRAENLQRVPIAVSAVSSTKLDAVGIVNVQQISNAVPGVSFRVSAGQLQPFIRGVGTTGSLIENAVGVYVDGIYLPVQREAGQDLINIQQVAVLKGPQGTLFGRNATGGIIQITTRDPTQDFHFQARTSFDNYETSRTSAYVAGGLGEGIAADVSATYAHQGQGWGHNPTIDKDIYRIKHTLSLRSKWIFDLGDKGQLKLIGDYLDRSDNLGPNFRPYPGTTLTSPGFVENGDPYTSQGPVDPFNHLKSGGIAAIATYDFDFATLTSTTSYRKGKFDYRFDNAGGAPTLARINLLHQTFHNFIQELQLTSGNRGPLKWTAGAFYFRNNEAADPTQTLSFGPLAPAPTSPAVITSFGRQKVESLAGYAQATYEIIENTNLTGGIRYTWERRDFNGSRTATTTAGAILPAFNISKDAHITARRITFRAALDHQFTNDVLGYISFNRGFKSGGFNVLDPSNAPYSPETLDAYEAGIKTQLFDRRLRLNLAGFYYDYKNAQVARYVNGSTNVYNGAAARIYGLDMDLDAQLARGLTLSGGMSVLHAKYTDFPNAVFSTANPAGGRILSAGDASGKALPYSQPLVLTASLDYEFALADGKMHANISNAYNGRFFTEPDNFIRQGSYNILSSSLRWTAPNDRFFVSVFGRNLLDKAVITQGSSQNSGVFVTYGNAPRTYGVEAGISF